MHKIPNPETRFISSSAKSHLRRVSLFLTYVFNAILLKTDTLFGNEMKVIGVAADWAARSSVIKNTAELIPLLHIWNTCVHSMLNIVPHLLLWNHVILRTCTLTFRHQI